MKRRGQNVSGEGRDVYGAVVTHRFFDVLRPRWGGCKDGENYCIVIRE